MLKSNGFKKKGLVWNRNREDLIDVIDIEKARFSPPDVPKIRGSAAICVPSFRSIMFDITPKNFQIGDGIFHVSFTALRTHDFSGREQENWIDLTDESLQSVGEMMRDTIRDHIIPFLDRLDSYDRIEEFLETLSGSQTKMPYFQLNRALLSHKLGDMDRCRIILASEKRWPEILDKVQNHIDFPGNK